MTGCRGQDEAGWAPIITIPEALLLLVALAVKMLEKRRLKYR